MSELDDEEDTGIFGLYDAVAQYREDHPEPPPKLDLGLWKLLLSHTSTNEQIKLIVECLDACWRIDETIMSPDDWPDLVNHIRECKHK